MSSQLIEINWKPSNKQLRQFAAICFVALPLIGWFWGAQGDVLRWLAIAGVGIAAVGLTIPKAVLPVFLLLSVVATPIGMVIGEISMFLIYIVVIAPIAFVFRLMGRDALDRKIDRQASSYWQAKSQPRGVTSYYRQS